MIKSNCHHKYLCWRAIFAGAIFAVGISFLFNLLTVGLGLSLYTESPDGKLAFTFAGVSWMMVGSYVILFFAGWITGRLVPDQHSFHLANGMAHGFIAWSLYLIVSVILLSLMKDAIVVPALKSFFIDLSNSHVAKVQATKLGHAGLVTFFIFFFGALGACIGAACGIKESKRCYMCLKDQVQGV
ncbi:MAG: hypothetical protein AB7I18_05805 [Candidatus Berkiella sp.]